jgi:hypothetical protein
VQTNSSGTFQSGALVPGEYRALVSVKGFNPAELVLLVRVGNTASANFSLQIGSERELVEVQGSAQQVNTEQATVQGVLNSEQIENLPINGRNFLDLAQLEPGVQIQDGGNITKEGFSSISFGGRFGRTARIEVDGLDVSDEIFGSTTMNIPASAIQEFQISQSSLDLSTELTTSGAVNVTTRSGMNDIHGEGFVFFRDSRLAAALPTPLGLDEPFQRTQFGARVGGPVLRNKLFYFIDGERTLQHEAAPVLVAPPLDRYSSNFEAPFRENNLLAKADYEFAHGIRTFYRFSYFQNSFLSNGGKGFSIYSTKNITRTHVAGIDFNSGSFSHSIRFGFLKYENQVSDATQGSNLPLANYPVTIQIGNTGLITGPNGSARDAILQGDTQLKYDGSKTLGTSIIRYGVTFNRIQAAGYVPLGSLAPSVFTNLGDPEIEFAQDGPFPGGDANPLNYPVEIVTVSNGLGYLTTQAGMGLPAGSFPYHRFGAYFGASTKLKKRLTLIYGVRYAREPGRSDSQFPQIPELNALIPGLGNPVRTPNSNFAPQFGFAWDPTGKGKTVLRGGIGLFYENVLTIVAPQDPTFRIPSGNVFLLLPTACLGPNQPVPVSTFTQGVLEPTFCSATVGGVQTSAPVAIGTVANEMADFQKQYQAGSSFDLSAPNVNYVGSLLQQGLGSFGGMYDPNYRTPRSVQVNIGIQKEIRPGLIVSADYLRNVQTHYFLGIDENHSGDIRYFTKASAEKAIAATLSQCGAQTVDEGISAPCPQTFKDTNGNARSLQIGDFAANGLTSAADFGAMCSVAIGADYGCAFTGLNSNAPPLYFFKPVGRSVYNALQTKLAGIVHAWGGAPVTLQVSYALSRFENAGGGINAAGSFLSNADQDLGVPALDYAHPTRFTGASSLDRTHQLSFGGDAELPWGLRFGIMAHFWSPLSSALIVPNTNIGPGEIFRTDFTGDGTVQDPMPGTGVGSFDRGINGSNINRKLAAYNNTTALQLTPAGQVLVQNGLFTAEQLGVGDTLCYDNPQKLPMHSLCAIAPPVPLAPRGQVNLAWMRALDLRVSWRYRATERVSIEPSAGFYNLFNFANFDLPGNSLSGLLTGGAGQVNGTTKAEHNVNRVGVGTGVYSLGAPRQLEFGLRVIF